MDELVNYYYYFITFIFETKTIKKHLGHICINQKMKPNKEIIPSATKLNLCINLSNLIRIEDHIVHA